MILWLLACAPDIRDLDGDGVIDVALPDTDIEDTDPEDTDIDTDFDPHVTIVDEGDGVSLIEVDSNDGVTYLDLAVPAQTHQLAGWEVSFERFFFRLNGGSNGAGKVEAVVISGQPFEALTVAPTAGWATDSDDGDVLADWYVYDSEAHVLYAADVVYAIRDGDGLAWKLKFIDYYDEFGNTGFASFRVAPLANP